MAGNGGWGVACLLLSGFGNVFPLVLNPLEPMAKADPGSVQGSVVIYDQCQSGANPVNGWPQQSLHTADG